MRQYLLLVFIMVSSFLTAQDQTVGVFLNDSTSFNGYTLLFPSTSRSTYLIDNCGYVVNSWTSDQTPGLSAYLLEDGSLLKTGRVFTNFAAGGSGGLVEIRSWDDEQLWSYQFADNTESQHHDIEPLPNGNILILSWERVADELVIFSGRDPSTIGNGGVWFEKVTEVKPLGTDSMEVVWEWRVFNHLIQEFDSTKFNYGVVADHPERLDINYLPDSGGFVGADWIHFNAVAYNPELDQIMLSSRNFSELYVIDHSTTTLEAMTSEGGKYGKGGDFLYRWGNPIVYQRGTAEDQRLFGQHDTHWIPEGYPDEGKIILFNNGDGRPDGDYSSIEIIDPDVNPDGSYNITADEAFLPTDQYYSFKGEGNTFFNSRRVSGAQQLPNGNILICDGNAARIMEIDPDGKLVWDYINPVSNAGPISQGTTSFNRDLFRALRYAEDYPAFDDKDMTPGDKLERDPIEDDCEIFRIKTNTGDITIQSRISLSPNPTYGSVMIENLPSGSYHLSVFDVSGRRVLYMPESNDMQIDLSHLESGLYFIEIRATGDSSVSTFKVIRS